MSIFCVHTRGHARIFLWLYNCGPALCLFPLTESCGRLSRLTGVMSTPARDVLGFFSQPSLLHRFLFPSLADELGGRHLISGNVAHKAEVETTLREV